MRAARGAQNPGSARARTARRWEHVAPFAPSGHPTTLCFPRKHNNHPRTFFATTFVLFAVRWAATARFVKAPARADAEAMTLFSVLVLRRVWDREARCEKHAALKRMSLAVRTNVGLSDGRGQLEK